MVQSIVFYSDLAIPGLTIAGMLFTFLMAIGFGHHGIAKATYMDARWQVVGLILVLGLAGGLANVLQTICIGHSQASLMAWSVAGGASMVGTVWCLVATFAKRFHLSHSLSTFVSLVACCEFGGYVLASSYLSNTELHALNLPELKVPGTLVMVESRIGCTDSGTQVRLYQRDVNPDAFSRFIDSAAESILAASRTAILRAEPSKSSNCHGWVFTNGKFIIANEDVDVILGGNSYTAVQEPQVGDLVVYRNIEQRVIHTGVVRGLLDEASPLVESKWGINGVYLHLALQQPYSSDVTYWRTGRISHALEVRSLDAPTKKDFVHLSQQSADSHVF